jgi:hypothetical protein
MHQMRIISIIIIFILLAIETVSASPIECVQDKANKTILITMQVPHPKHALVYRPDGSTVWLQTSNEFIHEQISDFGNLSKWQIYSNTVGTVWIDGKAMIQRVINGKGIYRLYIAENLETEPENTYFIECYFTVE